MPILGAFVATVDDASLVTLSGVETGAMIQLTTFS